MRRSIAIIATSLAMASAGAADFYGGFGSGGSASTGGYGAADRTTAMGDVTYGDRVGVYRGLPAEAQGVSRSYADPRDFDRYFGNLPDIYQGFSPSADLDW